MACSECRGKETVDCWSCHGIGSRGGSGCSVCSGQGELACSCKGRAPIREKPVVPFKGPWYVRVAIWMTSIASWIALMMWTQLNYQEAQAFAFWGGLVSVFVGSAFLEHFAERIIAAMRKEGP